MEKQGINIEVDVNERGKQDSGEQEVLAGSKEKENVQQRSCKRVDGFETPQGRNIAWNRLVQQKSATGLKIAINSDSSSSDNGENNGSENEDNENENGEDNEQPSDIVEVRK